MLFTAGNRAHQKYKTIKEFEKAFGLYLKHLGSGLSKQSFTECDYRTIEKYATDEEFFRHAFREEIEELKKANINTNYMIYNDLIEKANRSQRKFFEKVGINGMMGIRKVEREIVGKDGSAKKEDVELGPFNAAAWIFTMKNKFGWSNNDIVVSLKEDKEEDDFTPSTPREIEIMNELIKEYDKRRKYEK